MHTYSIHKFSISQGNGLGWNLDNTVMYYIDSLPRKVYAFDYNEQEGTVTNKRVCIDYAKDDSLGLPNGMCVDVQGFFDQAVTCWDMNTGDTVL